MKKIKYNFKKIVLEGIAKEKDVHGDIMPDYVDELPSFYKYSSPSLQKHMRDDYEEKQQHAAKFINSLDDNIDEFGVDDNLSDYDPELSGYEEMEKIAQEQEREKLGFWKNLLKNLSQRKAAEPEWGDPPENDILPVPFSRPSSEYMGEDE